MKQVTESIIYKNPGKNVELTALVHELTSPKENEIIVQVSAAGLNRADLLQRNGTYIVPEGETKVPGIEISGTAVYLGSKVQNINLGDRVCGVVNGGGFSKYCILNIGMALKVPEIWSHIEAAAFPEAALTANEALISLGDLREKQYVVIHAATSGMGTMLVQMAKSIGAYVICTTTNQDKSNYLYKLGADYVICHKKQEFYKDVLDITNNVGADLLIDFLAGDYFDSNISALRPGGKIVLAGILDGGSSTINCIPLINKYIDILPLTLRMKPMHEKNAVTDRFIKQWWDNKAYNKLKPIVHSSFAMTELDQAQKLMMRNEHIGKIVITMM